jgi:hypothetical protein
MVGAAAAAPIILAVMGPLTGSSAHTTPVAARSESAFAWLAPAPAPPRWTRANTASSGATLAYPPSWSRLGGDAGTVTAALRDRSGLIAGYLNVTPRQGAERLHGWARFRTARNREDGDGDVRLVAAAEGLRFRDARGSCVIDSYSSKVGGHPYQELACIVSGRRGTDVFIGAALRPDWARLAPTIQRAASSLVQQ